MTKEIRMVDTISQLEKIRGEIDLEIQEVLDSGYYINGPKVTAFTDQLSTYLDSSHVIPCGNGTDALQIALMALNLEKGDEVITTSFTFVATIEVIALLGLKPVFVDVEPGTFNLDPAQIEEAITPKTRCILPVHLYGQAANMPAIMKLAEAHGLAVIEDNAQAIGAEVTLADGSQQKSGTIGTIGTTSFYPSKNLGAFGDGGAICTDSMELAEQIQMICNHGSKKKYYYDSVGVNSRLDALQAAILGVKLRHLDEYNLARGTAAMQYDDLLNGVAGLSIPERADYSTHVFHQYTLKVTGGSTLRDAIHERMKERNIPTMIYYPVPLHLNDCYTQFGKGTGSLPVTEKLCEQVISLPMHTELDNDQQQYIVENLIDCLNQN